MQGGEPNFDSKDFYDILGLPREAAEDEIRRAYKRLALKYHPDKQGQKNEEEKKDSENKFKMVAEAYEVLSDKKKRELYDQYGRDGIGMGTSGASTGGSYFRGAGFGHSNFDMHHAEDIFRNFFGGRDPFADFFEDDDFMGGGFGFGGPRM